MLLEIDETDLICLFDLMDVDRSGDLTYEDRLDRRNETFNAPHGWSVAVVTSTSIFCLGGGW